MDNIIRQQVSINIEVMDLMNKQIANEMQASANYLALASWCDQKGFENAAKFFYAQSEEEREHMMTFFKFVNDNGGAAISPSISTPNHEFSSILDAFEYSLEQEIKVTEQINAIVKKCREVCDYASETLLMVFVKEQLEEEQTMRDIIDVINLMGDSPLKMIDERIPTE